MIMNSVADMSLDELRAFVNAIVEQHLQLRASDPAARSWDAVREAVDAHRWTPPQGTPSTLTMLREDRDR